MLENCHLCAHHCGINRNEKLGICGCGVLPKLSKAYLHMWEEPCISGKNGSGTVFFSGCNLKCIYCQNYQISHENFGKEISIQRLSEIFLELQEKNAHNINLVSPTPYVPQIIEALEIAKKNGLHIPIVYNTGNYENIETLKLLKGYVDIYLPDLKYFSNDTAIKYSSAKDYFQVATENIKEMLNQVGEPVFDENGIMQKGVMIRHLVLPSHLNETKHILEWIKENLPKNTYISIMMQYFPTYKAKEDNLIDRKVSRREYQIVEKMIAKFENGYLQELSKFEEEYVPNFDLSGIEKEKDASSKN